MPSSTGGAPGSASSPAADAARDIVIAYIVMAYIVMAYIVMAYIVLANKVMAYIVMAPVSLDVVARTRTRSTGCRPRRLHSPYSYPI